MDVDTFSRDQLFDVANRMTTEKAYPRSDSHLSRLDHLVHDITGVANQASKMDFKQYMKNLDGEF